MTSAFLSHDARTQETWKRAFPDLISSTLARVPPAATLIWILRPNVPGTDVAALLAGLRRQAGDRPLIVLADVPDEEEALAALAAGASGYCNGHAAPAVLTQVGLAVGNGGLWVGQNLMQRLLSATTRSLAASPVASNKEIANRMAITERTVKAHVGALLEKLGARDRLQLSLIVNGLGTPG